MSRGVQRMTGDMHEAGSIVREALEAMAGKDDTAVAAEVQVGSV